MAAPPPRPPPGLPRGAPSSTAEGDAALVKACHDFFTLCDVDGGGTISPMEFANAMKKQATGYNKKAHHTRGKSFFQSPLTLFQQIDKDGGGSIDEEEFTNYVKTKGDSMLRELLLGTDAITQANRDHKSGKRRVSFFSDHALDIAPRPEFMDGGKGNGKGKSFGSTDDILKGVSEAHIVMAARAFFKKCDADKGGTISPIEFCGALKNIGKRFVRQAQHSRGKSWFAKPMSLYQSIDKDGDGSIDEDEFVEYVLNRGDRMLKELLIWGTKQIKTQATAGPSPEELTDKKSRAEAERRQLAQQQQQQQQQKLAQQQNKLQQDEERRQRERADQEARRYREAEEKRRAEARDRAQEQAEAARLAAEEEARRRTANRPGRSGIAPSPYSTPTQFRADDAFLLAPKVSEALHHAKLEQRKKEAAQLEEVELQMLRGIFAAHDDNKDGIINKSQLAEVLVSLGFAPSEKLMTKFFLENAKSGKKHWRISLETFLSAAAKWLDTADDCSDDVVFLFRHFDEQKDGTVSAQLVKHLLHETVAPTRLSRQETEEFMEYADVGRTGRRGKHGGRGGVDLMTPVDYEALLDKLMF